MTCKLVRHTVLLLFLLTAGKVVAQTPDSLFAIARLTAYEARYNEAIVLLEKLLDDDSLQSDYRIFLARVYSWKKDYGKSDRVLQVLTDPSPPNEEAIELHDQVLFLGGQFERQVALDDKALQYFPGKSDYYRFRKALALERLGRDKEALQALDAISKEYSKEEVAYLRVVILAKQKNTISVGYLVTAFSPKGWTPWNFLHVGYTRRFEKWSLTGRVNYGRMFSAQALQVEGDAYVRMGGRSYLYANAGGSDRNGVFPLARFGFEYYIDPRPFLSVSAGGRYLYFSQDQVAMLTGHVAWIRGKHTISYRPFALLKKTVPLSHVLSWRISMPLKESYVQLEAQYGTVPYYFYTQNEFVRTSAFRTGLSGLFRVGQNLFVQPVLMYEYEEYLPGSFRNRFNAQLILARRF